MGLFWTSACGNDGIGLSIPIPPSKAWRPSEESVAIAAAVMGQLPTAIGLPAHLEEMHNGQNHGCHGEGRCRLILEFFSLACLDTRPIASPLGRWGWAPTVM